MVLSEVPHTTESVVKELKYDALLAAAIVKALGGLLNIDSVEKCAGRLRVQLKDVSVVDDSLLASTGASAVLKTTTGVHVIYGERLPEAAKAVRRFLKNPADVDLPDDRPLQLDEPDVEVIRVPATIVWAPLDGRVVPLSAVEDSVFSTGFVGDGVAMRPTSTTVKSPVNGVVIVTFPTKHAIGIKTKSGLEVLVHIGLDTVKLRGEGFTCHVEKGDKVEVGDSLITFDPKVIEAAGYPLTTPVIITNIRKMDGQVVVVAADYVKAGNGLFVIT